MTAEIVICALLVVLIVSFLLGEQYGRSRERMVRERMHDRYRTGVIDERRTLRDLAWGLEDSSEEAVT